jgi:endonuclease/exonuclease/phosphatase family metal-dependent hydrolase
VRWIAPPEPRDRSILADWCATVGPIVYRPDPAAATATPVDQLAIITWNVHVGAGDVDQLIQRLRMGTYTGGEPVEHFVLLLQEEYRREGGVPARIARGLPAPTRIESSSARRHDADVERIATHHRLALLYAPSMRNGDDGREPEDRGNAILSTLPLRTPTAIELPFEHQRRVTVSAVVESRVRSGVMWRLRVADVHLDTALALMRGGPRAARRRQAVALVEALAADAEDTLVGGDFNTWLGSREPALQILGAAFPDLPPQRVTTRKGPLGLHASLDHLFARGRVEMQDVQRLPDRLGSDHYPVLGLVRLR